MSLSSIQLPLSLVTVSVMANVPLEWCGQDGSHMLVCPAEVSGEETDQCQDKDQPCGTYCHTYWNRPKVYCGEFNSCVEPWSTEHIECRNKVTSKCFVFF